MIILANVEAKAGMADAIATLQSGGKALEAAVNGVSRVEEDPSVRSVGFGGWPNLVGEMECDAGVMDGRTLLTGAVGAVPETLHVAQLAAEVMRRLPHNMLVGAGARRFADEIGLPRQNMLMEDSKRVWAKKLDREMSAEQQKHFPDMPLAPLSNLIADPERVRDTTVFLALDQGGDLAVATSTSGWAWKYPGRLGDSPIAGAGFYADSRFGAAACTHTGEMTMRTCTAFKVVEGLRAGASIQQAVGDAAADLQGLGAGYLGEVVIHAIDRQGAHLVSHVAGPDPVDYWVWTPDSSGPGQGQSIAASELAMIREAPDADA